MTPQVDLASVSHRPWPLPERPWALRMVWHDLAFLHWPVDPELLRRTLPPGLELDTFDGSAWLGVVPFVMSGVAPRGVPSLPWLSAFPEINLRTYVRARGRPGVWFYSLDVPRRLAVWTARAVFYLPYFRADMQVERWADGIEYGSRRIQRGAFPAEFHGRYRPNGPVFQSSPGSLDHFLTERYALYSCDRSGAVYRGDVHHAPWPLQRAEVQLRHNGMTPQIGLDTPSEDPIVHFAKRLDVVAWRLRPIDRTSA